jgi:Domain of unknown function (DUF3291)
MQKRLALYTFGMFRAPADSPANQGFRGRNDLNLQNVDVSDGFIARSGYLGDPGPESWGTQVYPRFYVERGDGWSPSTLSLWADLESPMAYTYGGLHAEALRHGREWFVQPEWPPLVFWWVDHDHVPTWQEAVERHEFLYDNGPTPSAFHFKTAFDSNGRPLVIDREVVRQKMQMNSARHGSSQLPDASRSQA